MGSAVLSVSIRPREAVAALQQARISLHCCARNSFRVAPETSVEYSAQLSCLRIPTRTKTCMPSTKLHFSSGQTTRLITVAIMVLTIASRPSVGQGNPSTKTPVGTKILLLGTAGGPPLRVDRSEPSSLLIVDGQQYLIDCGIGTMRQMVRAGISSETISTIFITHHHPDHDLDLANVMANDFFRINAPGAAHTFNIYGPAQTEEQVKAAFSYISIPFGVFAAERFANTSLTNPFVAHDIQHDGVIYKDDKIRVVAAENSHYTLMPAQFRAQMKSYSYRIETPHGVIVFTGDTGPSDAVAQLAKGADVLVSEALDADATEKGVRAAAEKNRWPQERLDAMLAHMKFEHLSVEEVGKLASKAQVSAVLLYHLGAKLKGPELATFIAGTKKYFSGPVFAGEDLEQYCLRPQADGTTGVRTLNVCP